MRYDLRRRGVKARHKGRQTKDPGMIRSRKQNLQRRSGKAARGKRNVGTSRRPADDVIGRGAPKSGSFEIPRNAREAEIDVNGGKIHLTNLEKIFWPELGLTKRDLLQYYLDVSPWLLPHLKNRAMVMKRYPNGVHGPFFFMKRAPEPRPESIPICSIEHGSGNVIGFPVI
jgi:bifunctional non-homologous end joining protein LigD